jgi:beta-glucosidase
MKHTIKICLTIVAGICILAACQPKKAAYLDTRLSFEERAADLVSQMTLEEKVSQLRYISPAIDRLGIPEYNWWNECLHGVARSGIATVFPQAIGMAAMWDDQAMFDIATVISDEARAKHHEYVSRGKRNIYQGLTFWTPNINIFRDPRWGRGMETYGEDPYLTGELAVEFIKGLQGNDPKYFKTIATSKHFAVHSGPESTRHSANVTPSEYDLHTTYLPHFKKTVEKGGVYSVMCAYQRLNGKPCCGSEYLSNLLRNEWGFTGYIVSDCWAIMDFYEEWGHRVAETQAEAAAMAVKAGTDLNCGVSYPFLVEAVAKGLITEAEIDVSVRRLMVARMKLGQFDPPEMVSYTKIPYSVVDSKANQDLALEAARKSIVLLKNDNNMLPFSKDVKRVAVIGSNADDLEVLLGNYTGIPSNPKTPLQGIREKLPHAEVVFAEGCPLAAKQPYLRTIPAECFFTDASKKQPGLNAEYFNSSYWEGEPLHTRIDKNVDFIWWTTPPFEDMKYDQFSVRWSGVLVVPVSGEYAIGGEGFRGFRLHVDDKKLIDWGSEHNPHKQYEYLQLEAGKPYPVRLEYFQDNMEYACMQLLWDPPKPNLEKEAIDLAKSSDLVILCMGLSPLLEGEEMKVKVEGFNGGDREDIKLPATQRELIRKIHALGKPTVLVLLSGSAVAFNWEAENLPAIIQAWYPGQAGGTAIADVIFGDYNPAGRLPVTFYKSIDQISAFDNYDMQGKTYRYFSDVPLYEFGYGLSYTTFVYQIEKTPEAVTSGATAEISVKVTNTGKYDGDEVVQLYVSLPSGQYRVPVRSLEGFKRIHLKADETKTVNFTLQSEQMQTFDENNNRFVTPEGEMLVSVGGKQPDAKALASRQVVQAKVKIAK